MRACLQLANSPVARDLNFVLFGNNHFLMFLENQYNLDKEYVGCTDHTDLAFLKSKMAADMAATGYAGS